MHKTDEFGTVMMAIYVDDCLMVGDQEAVKRAIKEIKKHFKITHQEGIREFIGCKWNKTQANFYCHSQI